MDNFDAEAGIEAALADGARRGCGFLPLDRDGDDDADCRVLCEPKGICTSACVR